MCIVNKNVLSILLFPPTLTNIVVQKERMDSLGTNVDAQDEKPCGDVP